MDESTDAETLIESCSEPRAFIAVFERHYDAVHRYLRRRVSAEVADDLTAETFVRAYERRASYRPDRPDARPWLYGIATNLLRHHFRREERELRAFARSGVDPAQDPVLAEPAEVELARALAELAPGERDVLFLYVWADLSYEEIAEALALPLGTVRSRLHRARAKLRRLLAREPSYAIESCREEAGAADG